MPPIERPAKANSAGASLSTLAAIASTESQLKKLATITSLCPLKKRFAAEKAARYKVHQAKVIGVTALIGAPIKIIPPDY